MKTPIITLMALFFTSLPLVGETPLEEQTRAVDFANQSDSPMTQYRNSTLEKRLAPTMNRAIDAANWLTNGISPRACFSPEAMGSRQGLIDQLNRAGIRWTARREGEFECILRICEDSDIAALVRDKTARVQMADGSFYVDPSKPVAVGASECMMTESQFKLVSGNWSG